MYYSNITSATRTLCYKINPACAFLFYIKHKFYLDKISLKFGKIIEILLDFDHQFCLLGVILSSNIVQVLSNHHTSFLILSLIISPDFPNTLLFSILLSPLSKTYFLSSFLFSSFPLFSFLSPEIISVQLFTVLIGFSFRLSLPAIPLPIEILQFSTPLTSLPLS